MGLKTRTVLIPLTLLSLAGCTADIRRPAVYTRLMMDTVVEFSLWGETPAVESGFSEIQRIEERFSIFREDSELSKINAGQVLEMSPECRYLIEESIKYSELTGGAFDITFRPDKQYDLGGIAKGYAVDRVARIFKENGITRAMINIGGNLYLIGYPPDRDYWVIGIKDPAQPDRLIGELRLDKEVGIATSGNYERPRHIVDPGTGEPAAGLLGVTVVAPDAVTADALSTGVFVLGKDKGMELIESLPGVEGVIIDKDGIKVSTGLLERFRLK